MFGLIVSSNKWMWLVMATVILNTWLGLVYYCYSIDNRSTAVKSSVEVYHQYMYSATMVNRTTLNKAFVPNSRTYGLPLQRRRNKILHKKRSTFPPPVTTQQPRHRRGSPPPVRDSKPEFELLNAIFPTKQTRMNYQSRHALTQHSFALSLSYMDQSTWASRRVRSLQCLVRGLFYYHTSQFVHVVEPFIRNRSFLGLPPDPFSHKHPKFSDIMDIEKWNYYGEMKLKHPPLMRWEEFLSRMPNSSILIQIVYEKNQRCSGELLNEHIGCNLEKMKQYWLQAMAPWPSKSTVVKELCIKFQTPDDFMSVEAFNKLIFDGIPPRLPFTLVFNEYRGTLMSEKTKERESQCLLHVRDPKCSPDSPTISDTVMRSLKPADRIFRMAKDYTLKHLHTASDYIAVMVRWELIFTYDVWHKGPHYKGQNCTREIEHHLEQIRVENGVQAAFLATDAGRYGSSQYQYLKSSPGAGKQPGQLAVELTEKALEIVYGRPISMNDYDDTFEEISGSNNPALISQLHKAIAVRAKCLLIVGWSSFHQNVKMLYDEHHQSLGFEERCFVHVPLC